MPEQRLRKTRDAYGAFAWTGQSFPVMCRCTLPLFGSWADLESNRVALFYPRKGYTAEKRCSVCGGTGNPALLSRNQVLSDRA